MVCTAELRIGCLVMAAGSGSRFGRNKLEAVVDGKSLLRRSLEAVPAEEFAQVTVVTQYDAAAALAEEFGFTVVRNDRPEDGLSRTVLGGIWAGSALYYLLGARSLLVDLAAIGFGVAGVTEEFVARDLESGRLHRLKTSFHIPPRSVDMCMLRDVPQTAAAERFAAFVKESLPQT